MMLPKTWFAENDLILNISKTEVMVIQYFTPSLPMRVFADKEIIELASSTLFLGLNIDSHLKSILTRLPHGHRASVMPLESYQISTSPGNEIMILPKTWFAENDLRLNISKTEVMVIQYFTPSLPMRVFADKEIIELDSSTSFLGLKIDSHLRSILTRLPQGHRASVMPLESYQIR
ncbi:hypothetical protein HHI36_021297 [Cryptolaemus montrouzieri]|uniref:Uncharacterized protein n=1 Tax=Cryptolaemus montrouzieri TaxID=559131 RepID=A0ABD2MWG8_9CUCU